MSKMVVDVGELEAAAARHRKDMGNSGDAAFIKESRLIADHLQMMVDTYARPEVSEEMDRGKILERHPNTSSASFFDLPAQGQIFNWGMDFLNCPGYPLCECRADEHVYDTMREYLDAERTALESTERPQHEQPGAFSRRCG